MFGMVIAGFVLVLAMLLTMARMDLLKFLGYASIIDVSFTILMFKMFADSFSGIVAGSFAGLFMTALLYILKSGLGYKRLSLRKGWVYYPPKHGIGVWLKKTMVG